MAEHTKGIWSVEDGATTGKKVVSLSAPKSKRNIAHVGGPDRDSNAHLIAAAPELLASLKRLVDDPVCVCGNDGDCPFEQARTAIAKAEGR